MLYKMCDSQLVSSSHFHIRSSDRNDYWNTTPADFTINLSKPLKGTRAQIAFCQIPATYYNITSTNNKFNGGSGDALNISFTVPIGSYNLNDLMSAIQNLLNSIGPATVVYDNITGLINISNDVSFSLDFNVDNSIASVLGFSPNKEYIDDTSFTAWQAPKLFDNAIYISCNFATHIQTTSNLKNISFLIPHNVNKGEIIQFYSSTQFALQPHVKEQTIGSVRFMVFNEKGELLQGLADWAIMIQII